MLETLQEGLRNIHLCGGVDANVLELDVLKNCIQFVRVFGRFQCILQSNSPATASNCLRKINENIRSGRKCCWRDGGIVQKQGVRRLKQTRYVRNCDQQKNRGRPSSGQNLAAERALVEGSSTMKALFLPIRSLKMKMYSRILFQLTHKSQPPTMTPHCSRMRCRSTTTFSSVHSENCRLKFVVTALVPCSNFLFCFRLTSARRKLIVWKIIAFKFIESFYSDQRNISIIYFQVINIAIIY